VPGFLRFGEQSDGTLTVATQPAPGDVITLATRYGVPLVTETYVAGTDFAIGGSTAVTATNIMGTINSGALAAASASGSVVSILTDSGPVGALALTSSVPAVLVWDESPMTPGEAQVQFFLDCACSMINLDCWGNKADCGHIYLTAHFLTVASGIADGTITSKKIDKLAISYAGAPPGEGELSETRWGRMYMALKRTLVVMPVVGRGSSPWCR
jgi:hypothetical protein